jgi:hypothetical protein
MNSMIHIIEEHLAQRSEEIRHSRAIGNVPDAILGGSELFEALLILSLSAQTEAATREDLEGLAEFVFRPFFRDLAESVDVLGLNRPEFSARSQESNSLISRFQRFQTTIELAIRGEKLFPERVYLSQDKDFLPYSNECLLLWCAIVQDEGFRNYRRIIDTASREQWSRIIQDRPTPARVMAVFDDPADETCSLYYGFLRLVRYCSQLQKITTAISENKEIKQKDATLFNDRLREAFSWRVMIPSKESSRRVEVIKELWIRLIKEEAGSMDVELEFNNALETAFGMWYVPEPVPSPA